MKLGLFLLLGVAEALYGNAGTERYAPLPGFIWHSKTVETFSEKVSKNPCETWSIGNNSVPVHMWTADRDLKKNTSCLDIEWTLGMDEPTFSFNTEGLIASKVSHDYMDPFFKYKIEGLVYNSEKLSQSTVVLGMSDVADYDSKTFFGSIDSVDAAGTITAVSIVNAGKPISTSDPNLDVLKVKYFSDKIGTVDFLYGEDAQFQLEFEDLTSDGKGTVSGIKILNGGTGYRATSQTFMSDNLKNNLQVVSLPAGGTANHEVEGICNWVNEMGKPADPPTGKKISDCNAVFARDNTQTSYQLCICVPHGVSFQLDPKFTELPCQSITLTVKDTAVNGKFTVFAHTSHFETPSDGTSLESKKGKGITQNVTKGFHIGLNKESTYNLIQKWEHDDRNVRSEVTVKFSPQDSGRWNCDTELMMYDKSPYTCDIAKSDVEFSFDYLNKMGASVKTTPYVRNLKPPGKISYKKTDLPTFDFEESEISTACVVTRRPPTQMGKLLKIHVAHGGEGCTKAPMFQIKANSSADWVNVTLTLDNGAVTEATLPSQGYTYRLGSTWESQVLDYYSIENFHFIKHGSNYDRSKDTGGAFNKAVTLDLTTTGYEVDVHADVSILWDGDGSISGLQIDNSGSYFRESGSIEDSGNQITASFTDAGSSDTTYSDATTWKASVQPILTRNCKVPPQFELIYEYDVTKGINDDAKCKFIWEKKACVDGKTGTAQNYTLKDIVITNPGHFYYEGTTTDTNSVVTTYPYIQLPDTMTTNNWFDEKITLQVEAVEDASVSLINTNGIISAKVDTAGKGYHSHTDQGQVKMSIEFPNFKQLQRENPAEAAYMPVNAVVLEGGSGYKDYHQVCCSDTGVSAITSRTYSGHKIGTLTIEEGVITGATLHPSAVTTCGVDSNYFVCGATLKSIAFKDAKDGCGDRGEYTTAPKIHVNIGGSPSPTDDFLKQMIMPKVSVALKGDQVDVFTVSEAGWFPKPLKHATNPIELADYGGALKETCPTGTATSCKKSLRFYQVGDVLETPATWNDEGSGAILIFDDTKSLLHGLNGYKWSSYRLEDVYTTVSTDIGGVTAVNLARTGTHVFTNDMLPLSVFVPEDSVGGGAVNTADGKPTNFYITTYINKLSSDGTIPTMTFSKHPDFSFDHEAWMSTNTLDGLKHNCVDNPDSSFDQKSNFRRPRGFQVIIEASEKYLNSGATPKLVWGHTQRQGKKIDGLRIKQFGAAEGLLKFDKLTYDKQLMDDYNHGGESGHTLFKRQIDNAKLVSVDANFTQTWIYKDIQVGRGTYLLVKSPPSASKKFYPNEAKDSPVPGKGLPFATANELFSAYTSAEVSFDVKNPKDITDTFTNVTVYKPKTGKEHLEQRFRVCPSRPYYERIDFTTEVLEGNGKVQVFYGQSYDYLLHNLYMPDVGMGIGMSEVDTRYGDEHNFEGDLRSTGDTEYPFPNTISPVYTITEHYDRPSGPNQPIDDEPHRKLRCVDVRVVWDDSACKQDPTWMKPAYDDKLVIKLSTKVKYFGGECSQSNDCIDRVNQGGADEASLSVRVSANSDPDRFTMCYVGGDISSPTCRECDRDEDCNGGQYCFKADNIITNIQNGRYYTDEMMAWAQDQVTKHYTCQKKEGLFKKCSGYDTTNIDDQGYLQVQTTQADTTFCGGHIRDYDGQILSTRWKGLCVNHMCLECQNDAKGKLCKGGALELRQDLDLSAKNSYWENAAKLESSNEAATTTQQERMDVLTDVMGVTLMFAMLTTFATLLTAFLLMGRCSGCKSDSSNNKVAPE